MKKPTQEKYSTSLVTREMQVKTTMECHLPLAKIGVQTSNNTEDNTLVRMQRNGPLSLTARKVAYAAVLGKAVWCYLNRLNTEFCHIHRLHSCLDTPQEQN